MNQRPSTASTVLCALVLGSPLAAMAGGNDVVPVATPPAAAKDDSWEFLVKPYGWLSGVNGTLEALDMHVPVVTLVGKRHGERTSYSILVNLLLSY